MRCHSARKSYSKHENSVRDNLVSFDLIDVCIVLVSIPQRVLTVITIDSLADDGIPVEI
jgi:hypothetical protein